MSTLSTRPLVIKHAPSTRPLPRRVFRGGASLAAALALFLLTGCPSGYVQTESGATVAASTVYAQDIVGDALKVVQDVHNAAVMAHDAKAGQEPADVHAARRAKLLASAAGLRSGWDGLSAWKAGTEGGGMVAVAAKVRGALPGLLVVAVELKVIPQGTADAIGAFFGLAAQGKTPKPLQSGPYFDGCNWHTPLPFGGESVTSMSCGYSAQLVTAPLTSTLEVRP